MAFSELRPERIYLMSDTHRRDRGGVFGGVDAVGVIAARPVLTGQIQHWLMSRGPSGSWRGAWDELPKCLTFRPVTLRYEQSIVFMTHNNIGNPGTSRG